MAIPADYVAVVDKLLQKSRQNRVPWELPPGYRMHFSCTLDEFTFKISKDADTFTLRMSDSQDNELFSISAQEEVVFGDLELRQIYSKLSELFESARRKGLEIDKKLATVSGFLDRI